MVASVSAVYIGWADVQVLSESAAPLAYTARLLVCVAELIFCSTLWLWPAGSDPTATGGNRCACASLALSVSALSTLIGVLALEVLSFTPGVGTLMAKPEVIAISVMLGGFVVALFRWRCGPARTR